jgi:SAM-dependent methyltransferase
MSLYESTRETWEHQWSKTEFDLELASLDYPRSQEEAELYRPYLPKAAKIVEAGCGVGHIVYYWRKYGYNVVGLDYTWSAVMVGRSYDRTLPFVSGDIHALPFADESLGAYLSFGVLEHFEHGPVPALREAHRVLRRDGVLVLTIPYPNALDKIREHTQWLNLEPLKRNSVLRRLCGKPPAEPQVKPADSNGFYETRYTHREIARYVREAGFQKILVTRPISHSFAWYCFSRHLRKAGSYFETTPFCEQLAASARLVAPYATCFASLTVARKG